MLGIVLTFAHPKRTIKPPLNVAANDPCTQVEALLDRAHGGPPPVSWVVQQLEQLGYNSWAHRIVCSAGVCLCQKVGGGVSALVFQGGANLMSFEKRAGCQWAGAKFHAQPSTQSMVMGQLSFQADAPDDQPASTPC
jgi:hypothetical protein